MHSNMRTQQSSNSTPFCRTQLPSCRDATTEETTIGTTPDPDGQSLPLLDSAYLVSQEKKVGFRERVGGIQGDADRVYPL